MWPKRKKKKDFEREKPRLTPGLYDNLMHVWCLRVWKALCPIKSMQRISTCAWQRWSGSFRRRRGTEPAKGAQILQVEQAEINEHHRPHLFNTVRHWMNIPSVWKKKERKNALLHFQLLKQKQAAFRKTELLSPTSLRGEIVNAATNQDLWSRHNHYEHTFEKQHGNVNDKYCSLS